MGGRTDGDGPMGTTAQLLLKTDGDNHAVTFKITTPLYVIGKKNDSERGRLGKTFVFSPPRTHRTDISTEIGPQRAAVF